MKTATQGREPQGALQRVEPGKLQEAPMMNDLRDIYSDADTMFVVSVISDAMQRGVRHFKLDGTPLGRLNDVIDALAQDGEILMDAEGSEACPRH